jgi:hypothetical protein
MDGAILSQRRADFFFNFLRGCIMMHHGAFSKNVRQAVRAVTVCAAVCIYLPITACPASAQSDPNTVRNQANNNIQVASRLMDQAASLLRGAPSKPAMKAAIDLYAQAGQLAEQATRIYEALAPQYAGPDDVENSKMMVQRCIENIQHIKERM